MFHPLCSPQSEGLDYHSAEYGCVLLGLSLKVLPATVCLNRIYKVLRLRNGWSCGTVTLTPLVNIVPQPHLMWSPPWRPPHRGSPATCYHCFCVFSVGYTYYVIPETYCLKIYRAADKSRTSYNEWTCPPGTVMDLDLCH